jgi:hypothetical protein
MPVIPRKPLTPVILSGAKDLRTQPHPNSSVRRLTPVVLRKALMPVIPRKPLTPVILSGAKDLRTQPHPNSSVSRPTPVILRKPLTPVILSRAKNLRTQPHPNSSTSRPAATPATPTRSRSLLRFRPSTVTRPSASWKPCPTRHFFPPLGFLYPKSCRHSGALE